MSANALSITFVRGARSVTGSNFLVEAKEGDTVTRILIDCGLTQGERFCDPSNNEKFPYDPASIDALFVTHAHADHIGLIPKLVKNGFRGPIHGTAPTLALMPIMLNDTAHILVEEAKKCGEVPVYLPEDVEKIFSYTGKAEYEHPVSIGPITATLYNAGHILGSAMVMLEAFGTKILFTGDLGRVPAIIVPDHAVPPPPDYLVTESVYGDRTHEKVEESEGVLRKAVLDTARRKGTLLIPSFSLERTQIILKALKDSSVPVFMDSPLAAKVTEVYRAFPEFLKEPLPLFPPPGPLDHSQVPKIIVAGAGMSHGGRIREHEKRYLPDKNSMLLIVGYQVPGSLGRRLQDGARKVKIDGEYVTVRAQIRSTSGFSAHADRDDLMKFAESVMPREAFVVLGEMSAATFLAQRLSGFLGIKATIPQRGERYELEIGK
jgi:metallo-beta-lactamase family protein